jgi:hypothetical protein
MDRLTRQFVLPAVEISLSRLAALVPKKETRAAAAAGVK